MYHVSSQNTTVHHLRDLIESHKLEIGFTDMLLCNNIPALNQCFTPSWIYHTWKFMRDKNLTLEEATSHLQPRRQNYSLIVEDFIATGFEG